MNSVQKKLNLKFFCTEFVIWLPLPPKHQKDLSYIDIMRKSRTPTADGMSFRRCLSEGVDIFLKSVERQGESGHDVRVSQAMPAWLFAHMEGVCRRPRHGENRFITFLRKFTPGDLTSRKDVLSTMGVRPVCQFYFTSSPVSITAWTSHSKIQAVNI